MVIDNRYIKSDSLELSEDSASIEAASCETEQPNDDSDHNEEDGHS